LRTTVPFRLMLVVPWSSPAIMDACAAAKCRDVHHNEPLIGWDPRRAAHIGQKTHPLRWKYLGLDCENPLSPCPPAFAKYCNLETRNNGFCAELRLMKPGRRCVGLNKSLPVFGQCRDAHGDADVGDVLGFHPRFRLGCWQAGDSRGTESRGKPRLASVTIPKPHQLRLPA
jgi:hypothetical protein